MAAEWNTQAPVVATIGLGANLGDAVATLQQAIHDISALPGVVLQAVSSFYGSQPVAACGPDFVNAVMQIVTPNSAETLLQQLQTLERKAGRERPYPNAPRTLDLDVLLYGNARIDSPCLTVPHPRMLERAFVLVPLAEIAPEWASHACKIAAEPGQSVWRIQSEHRNDESGKTGLL
jgi:2-amino-4-hydroxy-6-hydroxymethyldihydropteridine diphosphokinase